MNLSHQKKPCLFSRKNPSSMPFRDNFFEAIKIGFVKEIKGGSFKIGIFLNG